MTHQEHELNMPRCATCKHWNNQPQLNTLTRFDSLKADGSWVVEHTSREKAAARAMFGNCAMLHETELVDITDLNCDIWKAPQLQTRADFGCVLWEARD